MRGPTGCRYLADARQKKYVQNGWNVTGDTYVMDADGYFWYQARSDDMIISAGYNIAGPEVESALLMHPAVAECGVVGVADEERGQIVKAYVVLRAGHNGDAAMTRTLQDYVKATIAPYKYPRAIDYRRRPAEDADRQAAALRIAPRRGRAGRAQACVVILGPTPWLRTKAPLAPVPTDDDLPRALLPQGWPRPSGYANGMTAKGRVVVTGGVVGWDVMQNFPDSFAAQARQTFSNILKILAEGGAGPEHLVRLTWYVTDLDEYRASLKELGRAYRETIGTLLSRDGGGAGRRPGREGRQDRDRGDGGRSRSEP